MLTLSVRVGQAVQVGDDPENGVVVKVEEKSGRMVRLAFATAMKPIRLIATGIIPPRFTYGITGEPRRVPEARILEPIAVNQ